MKVFTIRSLENISDELKNEIHFSFGMERHTDYVFKDRAGSIYSATINIESTGPIIDEILRNSKDFRDYNFIVDDLDLESNKIERYIISNGEIKEQMNSSWEWEVK